jgi:hypothetical protein
MFPLAKVWGQQTEVLLWLIIFGTVPRVATRTLSPSRVACAPALASSSIAANTSANAKATTTATTFTFMMHAMI